MRNFNVEHRQKQKKILMTLLDLDFSFKAFFHIKNASDQNVRHDEEAEQYLF